MSGKNIIKIDEAKCTGCGSCVPKCHKSVIQIINGKAKVVGEDICDGLGVCIILCPQGAISFEPGQNNHS